MEPVDLKPVDVVNEQINEFIKVSRDKTLAVEFLAALSINGTVGHNDLKCNRDQLKSLYRDARDSGLVSENFEPSESIKENLHDFLKSQTKYREIYDEVERRDVHERARRFLDAASYIDTNDAYQYLANLAIKGEVKSSDLNNNLDGVKIPGLGSFFTNFKNLNNIAVELKLVLPGGYLYTNSGVATEETQEALQKFFMEGNQATEYQHKYLLESYNLVKKRVLENDPGFEMATESWKPFKDKTDDVAGIKNYLAWKIEKTFPGSKAVVKYGIPKEEGLWSREIVFKVDMSNRNRIDDCLKLFKKIFPDLEGDSGVFIYKNEDGRGFYVSGKPELVAGGIMANDPMGWNRRNEGQSKSWWQR